MEIIKTKVLTQHQCEQLNSLWNSEYPTSLKDRFGILLDGVEHFLHYIIEEKAQILAWAVAFEKEDEIRFSIIVNPGQQGKGLGKRLIDSLKEDYNEFYGWVIDHNNDQKTNGEFYLSPLTFYVKLGFEVLEDIRINNEMLKAVKIRYRRN